MSDRKYIFWALLTASGQNCWPPMGSFVTAYGRDLMAADTVMTLRKTARDGAIAA